VTAFHVPLPGKKKSDEETYVWLASVAGCPVPKPDRRIDQITFMHDGTLWTATVGQQMTGVRHLRRRRGGRMVDVRETERDNVTVVAIFAGAPYMVCTTAFPLGNDRSAWVNPFLAGVPQSVKYFEPVEAGETGGSGASPDATDAG
jgi:hypothetical protein